MFNAGIIADPYKDGWSRLNTPLDVVTLSNGYKTATLNSGVTNAKSFRAVRSVSSGTLEWWITLNANTGNIGFGVVGSAVSDLGVEDGDTLESWLGGYAFSTINMNPSMAWYNFGASSMTGSQVWSGGGSVFFGPDKMLEGTTLRFIMDADSKRITIYDYVANSGGGQVFRDFDAPDQGPWYPACTLIAPGAQVTLSYSDPNA